ncbi:hypothetical protein [Blautia obeum]|uniref:Uncharacterized protein n=1 Tax=Blautia obeum TaxID=40520 RepID=A0A414W140_9FIRM|nr:hypothetical protein [Blautia obeum]RHH17983.1 hypothetical protein DW222_11405 [Blautia obeum]
MKNYYIIKRTKKDILDDIKKTSCCYFKNVKRESHSDEFFFALESLFREFMEKIEDTILIDPLPEEWEYSWRMDYYKFELLLMHYEINENKVLLRVDQVFTLIKIPVPMLTAEEFAMRHNIKAARVTQWIRRCKIRTAYKSGRTWRISALTDLPTRGYMDAVYEIPELLDEIPDKFYPLISKSSEVIICRDKDNIGMYEISLYNKKLECVQKMQCNTREREEFEGVLIANPKIKYKPIFGNVYSEIISLKYRGMGDGLYVE